jgi:hypothetical protein
MGDAEVDLDSIIDRLVAGEWHCSLIPSPGAPRKMALCAVDAGCFNAPGPLRVHEIRQRKGVLSLNILHHVPPPPTFPRLLPAGLILRFLFCLAFFVDC